jgi:hypothetical protein
VYANIRDLQPVCVVYCPKCRADYREGFSRCSDCQVLLVAENPPATKGPEDPDPDLELVTVLEGADPAMITAAKNRLDESGIPFYVFGEEVAPRIIMEGFIHRGTEYRLGVTAKQKPVNSCEISRPSRTRLIHPNRVLPSPRGLRLARSRAVQS